MSGALAMLTLENIVPGIRLTGVAGDATVEVVSTRAYGTRTARTPSKLCGGDPKGSESAFSRARTSFAFDGDRHHFRLASEALRIRLAHLFDSHVGVNASQIEPLPHQLTGVYGAMLIPRA